MTDKQLVEQLTMQRDEVLAILAARREELTALGVKSLNLFGSVARDEAGVGDSDRLMRTLGQDVDAVLFVRMPKPSGDYWADVDVQLYDTARAALVELNVDIKSAIIKL